jgi:hypothetical protein
MEHKSHPGISCSDFESRLSELLDGLLGEAEAQEFQQHAQSCLDCGELFTRAQTGMALLRGLEEVDPPANLVHNILAATAHTDSFRTAVEPEHRPTRLRRVLDWIAPGWGPLIARAMQPRFAMTAAMAFFSITLLANIAGLKWSDLRRLDLRPSALTTEASLQYHETTARIVKYYENIRFVYELETRVRELRQAAGTEEEPPQQPQQQQQNDQQPKQENKDNSSQEQKQQNRKQNEEYSQTEGPVEMASMAYPLAKGLAEIRRDS